MSQTGVVASQSPSPHAALPVTDGPTAPQPDDQTLAAQWTRVRARLRSEAGEAEYRSWLRQMTLGPLDGDELTIYMPTHFLRDWVRSHYGARLSALWTLENPAIRRVDVRQADGRAQKGLAERLSPLEAPPAQPAPAQPAPAQPAPAHEAPAQPAHAASQPASAAAPRQPAREDLAGTLNARYDFNSFVVGKPNEFAYACARRVAAEPASRGFNPLFLYGGVGLGKTHLMHAIAWELMSSDACRPSSVAYMSAEKFMYRFIGAIRNQSTIEFKSQLRSVDVLMIDDLQFLIGKDNTQDEFFHTFNALVEDGRQMVVSADKSPSDLDGLDNRLRTRLGCGMVADLHATTFELRLSILEAKAASAGIAVPHKVIEFLATRIASNVRELEGALNRLIAHANLFDRAITLEGAQDVLADLLKAHDRQITIDEIQKKVAEHFAIRLADMFSPRRSRSVARPRQVAMYLAKQLTTRSLPEIGRKFGNRDHTTVMHGIARVHELMLQDRGFADDVDLIRRNLEH